MEVPVIPQDFHSGVNPFLWPVFVLEILELELWIED